MPDFLTLYVAFFIFLIGLCIGSFLNVVILRGLAEESIVFPPSKCPKCNKPLKWWHNMPLISYILLKGKCYYCHEKISIQYFLVELTTAILFVATFLKFGYTFQTLVIWGIVSMFIVMSVTDLKEKVIFDLHSIILAVLGIILSILNNNLANSLLGMAEGILIMEILASTGYLLVKSRAFGVGDTFIAGAFGAIFGWKPLLMVLILSLIVQAVMTLPLFIRKLYKQKDYLTIFALITFLIIAGIYKVLLDNPYIPINGLYITLAFLIGTAIYTTKRITGGLKTSTDAIMLPFGPAMFVAATIILFTV